MSHLASQIRSRAFEATGRVHALVEVALSPGGPGALLRQRPLSLSAFELASRLTRLGLTPASLIDVGANRGQFTAAALYQWPAIQVHAFEPLPDEVRALEASFSGQPNVHVESVAVGDEDGIATLHRHSHRLSSSLLRTSPAANDRYHWAAEDADIEVPVRRLDSMLADIELSSPVLLKVDVQGFESQVFRGAQSLLPKVSSILVEQSFERFYEGQRPFPQAHADLVATGWVLARVLSMRSEEGLPVEADCLYLPAGSMPLASMPTNP
jgi:FkbM family methyltransferase